MSGSKRIGIMPDVPTIAEQGYPGFDVVAWYGIRAPAKTPPEIIRKLNTEINAILKQPEVKERMLAIGLEPVGSPPGRFAEYLRAEVAKWAKVVRVAGIRID